MIKPTLCHDLEWDRVKFPGCVSPKIDGVRAFYEPGNSYLYSRNHKPIYGMEHIVHELSKQEYPVDMELSVPGLEFNELSGLIRNHNSTPEAVAHVIDMPVDHLILEDRLLIRPRVSACIQHIPHIAIRWMANGKSRIESYYELWLEEGYEGLVYKALGQYYPGNRSWHWQRLVPVKSIDVTVELLYEGEGKLKNMCGGFYFTMAGLWCKCGTMLGVTHEERAYMWLRPEEYVGLTAIVEYKELQPSGMPRQPRSKGFRNDK